MDSTQYCLRVSFPVELKEIVLAALFTNDITSFQEGDFGLSDTSDAPNSDSIVQCFFATERECRTLKVNLQQSLPKSIVFSQLKIAEEDWKERWKDYSKPVEISPRLIVHSSWHSIENKTGRQEIVIDPEMAFGTGSHPTTKMCLQLIDSIYTDIASAPKSVLDVGCGSGILSIAADIFGATEVLGIDIDSSAISVSATNAAKNKAWNCQFSETPLESVPGTFDLVIANILSSTLISLWPEITSRTKPGGSIIISGLLAEEQDSFFDSLKLSADEMILEDSWLAARLCC